MVEKVQQNKNSWNYATWQMKIDLIYDMRHDGSGAFGGFSEEDKEDAVIVVLESSIVDFCRGQARHDKIGHHLDVLNPQ